MNLPAFKITTESGYAWVTSMAKDVTLEMVQEYFVGRMVNVESFPSGKMSRVIKVEQM